MTSFLLLLVLSGGISEVPEYSRSDWSGWLDVDRNCLDSREEALIEASLAYTLSQDECSVDSVVLVDQYSGEHLSVLSRYLDVDHAVPLEEAHESGGWRWSKEKKKAFANDPFNLVPTSPSINRSKGSRDPGEWLPPDDSVWCFGTL